jgi:hypothetical protein
MFSLVSFVSQVYQNFPLGKSRMNLPANLIACDNRWEWILTDYERNNCSPNVGNHGWSRLVS